MKKKTQESDSRYRWGNYEGVHQFSDAEIDQIVALAKNWASGWLNDKPIDKRHLSREVVRYGIATGLCEYRSDNLANRGRLFYRPHNSFEPSTYLPPEALWRIFRDDIFTPDESGTQGYSITKSHGWGYLNICRRLEGSSFPDQTDEMIRVICRLNSYGYLIFQYGGSVWDITILRPKQEAA